MKTYPLPALSLTEATRFQFALVDAITRHFPGADFLSNGDLGLVAGLGVGGIAIGLAAQGIFSDLFAALSILFDKPFRRGDAVSYDTTSGTVEAIGLKTTRVRSITGEERVISNAQLLNKEIQNKIQSNH